MSRFTRRKPLRAMAGALALVLLYAQAQAVGTKPQSPEALHQALAAAFNTKDVDQVLALYETDGALVPQPGQVVTGTSELREALMGFLAIEGTMDIVTSYSVETDGVALTRSLWTIRKGDEIAIQKMGTEVMRRQADGTWLFLVDHPFGGEPLTTQ